MCKPYWDAWCSLALRGEPLTLAAWAREAGTCLSSLVEARRHDPALRALPTRGPGRPPRNAVAVAAEVRARQALAVRAAEGVEAVREWARARA